jgi:hypothetical protein
MWVIFAFLLLARTELSVDGFQPLMGALTRSSAAHRRPLNVQTSDETKTMLEKEPNYLENPYSLEGTKPAGAPVLATQNFLRQGPAILQQLINVIQCEFMTPEGETPNCVKEMKNRPPACFGLKLSNEAVTEAERIREAEGERVDANMVSRGLYDFGCLMLDSLFDERPIQRFWFLEVIARIPYFSYTS